MLPSNLILAIFMVDGHHDHDLLILILLLRCCLRVPSTMITAHRHKPRHHPRNAHRDHHGDHGDHPRLENCLMFTESPTL